MIRHPIARRAVAICAVVAVAAVAFRELLAGRLLFEMDAHMTFAPLREGLGRAWNAGWPLWDARIGNGVPLPANPLEAAWYPPNLLFALGEAPAVLTWLTVAHVLLGALGARALARRLGMGESASWVAGVVFGFNGVAMSATAFANLSWSAAWLPWLLERWLALIRTTRPLIPASGVAVVFSLLLAIAEPFVLLAAIPALAAMSVEEWFRSDSQARANGRRASRLLIAPASLAAGALIAAPSLLAALRYLPVSVRAPGFVPDATMYWSTHPLMAIGMLVPGVFGDARLDGLPRFWATALSPEKGFPLLIDPYLGGIAVALALSAAVGAARRQWVWLGWGVLLVLLALGRHGPLYPWLAGLPPLSSLRFPIKWLVPATLPLALLVGAGAQLLQRDGAAWRRLAWIVAALLLACGAAAQLALPALEPLLDRLIAPADAAATIFDDARLIARETLLAGTRRALLWLGATLGVAWFVVRHGSPARRRIALMTIMVLAAADLAIHAPRAAPSAPPSLYAARSPLADAILADAPTGRAYIEAPPYVELTFAPPPAHAAERALLQRMGLFGYVGASQGLKLAFNPDVGQTRPIHYARLGSLVRQAPAREKAMLLGAANVSHVASYDELDDPDLTALASIRLGAARPVHLYRNELALPRVRLVPRAQVYADDSEFISSVIDGPRTLFEQAVLIDAAELRRVGLELPSSSPVVGRLQMVRDDPSRLSVRSAGPGGWLVVAETWVPGWHAAVDGRGVPLVRADYAFRAVHVPAGDHTVELRYRSW